MYCVINPAADSPIPDIRCRSCNAQAAAYNPNNCSGLFSGVKKGWKRKLGKPPSLYWCARRILQNFPPLPKTLNLLAHQYKHHRTSQDTNIQ